MSTSVTSATQETFGPLAALQRCQIHKRRNILGHLPDHLHESVKEVLRDTWSLGDAKAARRRLERLASSVEADHPGAAASVGSVRESMKRSPSKLSASAEGYTRSF